MESAGISRAMGVNRYEGVGNALRMARELSREQIPEVAAVKMQRGPCPGHLRNPSIPSILTEEERQSAQYAKDLERGLQAVYGQRRRQEPATDPFDNGAGAYAAP